MTREQFEALVTRLERQARKSPATYKLQVFFLALLGNLYLAGVLLATVAVLVALVASARYLQAAAAKFVVIVGAFLLMLLRALWVRVNPPAGILVRESDAPELFRIIDKLRRALSMPRLHQVLVTHELNAAVHQAPRFGIFAGSRNYLVIGLPLMQSLTIPQFEAVLAHEFGHLSRGHGRLSNWLYRQRLRWSRLTTMLKARNHKGAALFTRFLGWYGPYFNAYSFPLARVNEYEADAAAVRLTSPQALAEALTRIKVVGSYLSERYWPAIHRQAADTPQPAFMPHASLGQRVAQEIDDAEAKNWLTRALKVNATVDDTHPSLSERLRAIDAAPQWVVPRTGQSADRLLGPSLDTITQALDNEWQLAVREAWRARYQEVQQERSRFIELNRRHDSGEDLSVPEAYERALLTESVAGDAQGAITQLHLLRKRAPGDAIISYALGARLLQQGDESGCSLIEEAMTKNESAVANGCQLLRDYYWRQGDQQAANRWQERLMRRVEEEQNAAQERRQIQTTDKFDNHDLSAEDLEKLLVPLRAIPKLRKVYLVKKRVRFFPERPLYVMGYTVAAFWPWQHRKLAKRITAQISETVRFPGQALFLCITGKGGGFQRKFTWMRGSRIL